jgi:hypothetical protein
VQQKKFKFRTRTYVTQSPDVIVAGAPDAPVITAASVTATTGMVTFTAPPDNGATIIDYPATATAANGISNTATVTQSIGGTITVTGLTVNTSYSFTVTARNTFGSSTPSNAMSATTPLQPQATLRVSNTQKWNNNDDIILTTSGGSGTGAVSYTVTGQDCSIKNTNVLDVTSGFGAFAMRCIVTAKKAADGDYAEATSATKTFEAM